MFQLDTANWPDGDSEMASRIRTHDWAATSLGPICDWSPSLRTAVGIVVGSGHAMQLAWGPERVIIYNDAYAPMLGARHPGALGLPLRKAWPDVWQQIEPLVARAFRGETVRFEDFPLTMSRHGHAEETWWNFSYSPVRDESGAVAGLLNVTVDATPKIRADRAEAILRKSEERQAFLLKFSDALRSEPDADAVAARALAMLAEQLALDRCYINFYRPDDDEADFPYQIGNDSVPPLPPTVRLSDFPDAYERVLHGTFVLNDDLERRASSQAERVNSTALGMRAMLASTVRRGEKNPLCSLAAVSSRPRQWSQAEIALVEEAAERVWAAMERARADAALRESEEKYRTLFESIDEGICVIELIEATDGNACDFRYIDVNDAYGRQSGLGDVTGKLGSEVVPGAETYWHEAYAEIVRTGESKRVENYNHDTGHWYTIYASRVGGSGSRRVCVVSQDTTERRKREERQAFLLKLSDAIRPLVDAEGIRQTAANVLGEHLGASRVAYAEDGGDGESFIVYRNYVDDVPDMAGRYRYADFGGDILAQLGSGENRIQPDLANDERLSARERQSFAQAGIGASLNVPLVKGGRLVAFLGVNYKAAHVFLPEEIALVEETAERAWAAVERARAEAALHESDERQAFLLKLSDALRPIAEPLDVPHVASCILGEHLGADRVAYAEFDADEDTARLLSEYRGEGTAPLPQDHYRWSDFDPIGHARGKLGLSVSRADVQQSSDLTAAQKAVFEAVGFRALVNVPLVKSGRLLALLTVHWERPHEATNAEIYLVEETAERTWAGVERARALAALQRSEEEYRSLFTSMGQGYIEVELVRDADGRATDYRYVRLNPAYERLTGIPAAQAVGRASLDVIPDLSQVWVETFADAVARGTPQRFDYEEKALGRWYRIATYPHDGDRLTVLAEDVTEEKRAQAMMKRSEERLRALVTAGAYSIYRMSPDWRLMFQLEGGTLAATVEPIEYWIEKYIPEEDLPQVRAAIEQAIRTKSLFELEHRVRVADGSIGWVASRAVPLLGPRGEIVEWFGTGTDVTSRKRAEGAMRESEERFREFGENSSDALWIVDAHKLRLEYLSPAFERIWGESREAVMADTGRWAELVHPDDRARAAEAMPRLLSGEAVVSEYRIVRADGEVRWIRDAGFPIRQDGVVKRGGGIAQDVTELKHAESAVRHSEERFRQFGEASQDVLWIRDAGTLQWTYLTPAFETIYGLSREDALAGENFSNWLDLVVPDDRALASACIERVRNGERVTFEYRVRRPADGEIRWLRNTDFPIRDVDGRVASIGGIGHDVTGLKRIDLALAAAEQRQRSLVEGIPQLVWSASQPGWWKWASPQWTSHTGQSDADSHGWGWLDMIHPDDREDARAAWDRATDAGGFDVEYRVHDAHDGYHWFQTRATPVRDDRGSIIEWIGTSTDVDNLRQLQERQRVLVAELQHRTRNLITVVAALSHQTMRDAGSLEEFDQRFSDRLSALSRVQGLLSHLTAGSRVTFDELLRSELTALGAPDGKVTLDGPANVPLRSTTIQTFSLALHELATNALKYGALAAPEGHLTIRWKMTDGTARDPRLHVDWRETGVLIEQIDDRPRGGGYGRELIERALPYQLDAKTTFEIAADGVHCTIELPISTASASMRRSS